VVEGNFIGTDKTGTVALGNTQIGVAIILTSHNRPRSSFRPFEEEC